MLNIAHIHGRLTDSPELRSTPGGKQVCTFTIASNQKWTDEQGDKQEAASFIPVTTWGALAETVARFKKKGHPVIVSGYLKTEQWKDKADGKARSRLVLVASTVEFLPTGDKKDS